MSVKQVACGEEHLIFVSDCCQVFSLGGNNYGQLGLGDYVESRHPDVGGAGGAMAPPLFCQNIIRRNVKISLVITDYRFKSRIA